MTLLAATTTLAGRVDQLFWFLTLTSSAIALGIFLMIATFAIRYRRRTEDEIPPETPSNLPLEIGWTLATFAGMLVMFFWGTRLYIELRRPPAPGTEMEIDVLGKQWMWKIQHPAGQREIDELHIPVGRPVRLVMSSQDVIHSFGIPAFRIKQDVLPGTYTSLHFTATRPGRYRLFCQEYCGTSHSAMIGWVTAMEPQDYQSWLAGVPIGETPIAAGAALYRSFGCAQCHGQLAPTLAGLFGRQVRLQGGTPATADENYLRESILNPAAKIVQGYGPLMPSYRGQITEEQLADLVAYIKSLAPAHSNTDAAPPPPPANVPPAKEEAAGGYRP